MINKILPAILLSTLLFIGIFAPVVFAPQPPLYLNTFLIGTIPGVIYRIDPTSAYDTASATVDMNVYDTLIWFDRNTSASPPDQGLVGEFIPQLAEQVPTDANGKIQRVFLDIWYNGTEGPVVLNQDNPFFTYWFDITGHHRYYLFDWIDNTNDETLTPMDVVYVEELYPDGTPIPCTTHVWSVVIKEHDIGPYPFPNVHMQLKRSEFYFKLKTGLRIQPWIDQNGVVHSTDASPDYLTPADCEYSISRGIIQNIGGGPMFMFMLPMFDQMTLGYWSSTAAGYWQAKLAYYGYGSKLTTDARKLYLGRLIDCNVFSNESDVCISLGLPFPLTAWYQIIAQSWGGIVPKAFSLDHGCWNGTYVNNGQAIFFAWRRWPDNYMSPLDMAPATDVPASIGGVPTSKYTNHPTYHGAGDGFDMHGEHIACGTGPYKFTYYDDVLDEWRIDRFTSSWKGWTPDAVHPYYLDTIIDTGIESWNTRRSGFLAGDFDTVAVNRDVMHTIMTESPPGSGHWVPLPGLVTWANLPALTSESFHYNYHVVDGSPYLPTMGSPAQNVSDFFANAHARKAFSYAINFTKYIAEAWLGEAVRSTTWYVAGLSPDYRLFPPNIVPYDIDLVKAKQELKDAVYYVNGHHYSLMNGTWSLQLLYNSGSSVREKPLAMIKDNIETLVNGGGEGGHATITLVPIDWDTFNNNIYESVMSTFLVGWLVDYAHPDDWVRPYMHSAGDFSAYQFYANATVDYEITLAMKTDNAAQCQALYEDLQLEFIRECLTLILAQPTGRAWMRNWVNGWYYNGILPGAYYRDRWKGYREDVSRDGKVNLSDLIKIAGKFGCNFPAVCYDIRYDLNSDGKINLSDLIKCAAKFGLG